MAKPINRRCSFPIPDWIDWQSGLGFRCQDLTRLGAEPGLVASQSQLDPLCFLHSRMKQPFSFGIQDAGSLASSEDSFCYKTVQEALPQSPPIILGLSSVLILKGCLQGALQGVGLYESGSRRKAQVRVSQNEPKPGTWPWGPLPFTLSRVYAILKVSVDHLMCPATCSSLWGS